MYRATIYNTTGIAPYGDGEIIEQVEGRTLQHAIAEVERRIVDILRGSGQRPQVVYHDPDGAELSEDEIDIEVDQLYDLLAEMYGFGEARRVLSAMGHEVSD